MIKVGVIGTGIMGTDHARILSRSISGATVGAVFDVDAGRAAAAADGARVLDDPLSLIKDSDVDAVLIASSDETHEEFVLAALTASKPVLCEKPLAPDVAGCLRIVDAEASSGQRLVSVGFMRRYDTGYVELKRTLDRGAIGAPLLLHCVHRNVSAPEWFRGDMVITNSSGHEIDIARWLLGDEIAAITVHRPRRSDELVDPVLLVLETASGVVVDVEVFVNARYGYDVRCELVGERGTVTLVPDAPALLRRDGVASSPLSADWRDRFADAYRRELQDWVHGVRAGQARGATAWDGYVATAVAHAGVAALGGGQTPVELAPKPQLYK
jgi:myo-inositol 2-dehydrogenase / D-chiro-inositol 1-dehydrogenase